MTARKPPTLANWLLNRSGFARENPPLAGDLLEEFGRGRSAAWYWRQTLVVISTGLVRAARLSRGPLMATVIGWAAETGIAFALWWFHFPPRLPNIVGTIATVVAWIYVLWSLRKKFRPKPPADNELSVAETVESEERGEDGEDLVMLACLLFIVFLPGYCVVAMLWGMPLWFFIFLQGGWLLGVIKDVTAPASRSR